MTLSARDLASRQKELETILRAATPIMMEGYSSTPGADLSRKTKLGTLTKTSHADLVTIFDKRVEEFLLERLSRAFPGEKLIGEELTAASGKTPRQLCEAESSYWIIDPIDGTTNYSRSYPFFCSTAAWVTRPTGGRDEAQVGAVWNPIGQEMFSARKGGGAWLNRQQLRVSQVSEARESLLSTGFANARQGNSQANFELFKKITQMTLGVRRDGSAALDMAYVASGRTDAYWEWGLSPWDIAAGTLLVNEAGGRVTRHDGSPVDLLDGEILSSNALLHKWLESTVKVVQK